MKWKLLAVFAKSSILDVWQGSEYAPHILPQCNNLSQLFQFILKGTVIF